MKKPHKATLKEAQGKPVSDESLAKAFWSGFFLPFRLLGKGLVWLAHKPPLKQIGHVLRWFGRQKPIRIIAKYTGIQYIINSFREIRSVTWPTFKDSLKLTRAVVIFSLLFGAFIAAVDYGLDKLFKQILLK